MKIRSLLKAIVAAILGGTLALAVTLAALDRQLLRIQDVRQNGFEISRSVAELYLLAQEYKENGEARPLIQWQLRHAAALRTLDDTRAMSLADDTLLDLIERDFRQADAELHELMGIRPQLAADSSTLLRERDRMASDELAIRLQSALGRAVKLREIAHELDIRARRAGTHALFFLVAISVLIVFASALVAMRRLTIPIDRLRRGAAQIGSGDLDHRIPLTTHDEIGEVAQAINLMAGRLKAVTASRDELQRETAERVRAEAEVRSLNLDLERRVQERTRSLEAVNQELESFTYSVSHDLRVPLRAISGFVQILEEDHAARLDAEGLRVLNVITENTRRMGQLIDDLLTLSRIGRAPLSASRVDMHLLVHDVLAEVLPPDGGARCTVHPLPEARGERALLRQVWVNLLTNAVKFSSTQPQPRIEIGGSEAAGEIVYFVRDNGVGFDMRYYEKLFGVFQRLHTLDEFPGTGVGLAIVHRVVSRHGGRVWAESELGTGTTFYFALPNGGANG